MSRVITFSRVFPSYHPRKGEQTFFIEQILNDFKIDYTDQKYFTWLIENNPEIEDVFLWGFFKSLFSEKKDCKAHTIRNHKTPLKIGEFINPKCWAGSHLIPKVNPYNKTPQGYWQIKFAPNVEIKKTWNFRMTTQLDDRENDWTFCELNGKHYTFYSDEYLDKKIKEVCKNDGLSSIDFFEWFEPYRTMKQKVNGDDKVFDGNIICWDGNVNY